MDVVSLQEKRRKKRLLRLKLAGTSLLILAAASALFGYLAPDHASHPGPYMLAGIFMLMGLCCLSA